MKSLLKLAAPSFAALAAASAMVGSSASAGDTEGRYAVKGVGLMPCKMFIEQVQQGSPQAAAVVSWLDGYVSGANMLIDDTYDLVSWQDGVLPNILASTCAQAPDQPVAVMAGEIVKLLGPQRVVSAERPETITVGEAKRLMYPSVVKAMQQKLKDNGIAVGVDGDFGPGTQRAISGFQTANNLPSTGFPDPRTMVALFTPKPTGQ
ncbi:MAG: peptidoglycan-binding protein [Parvularculaceae bacterium]|nr:peptidoglycan-binding protein [Parvularculaceae bacterium]